MTTVAHNPEAEQRAWRDYADRLQGLAGPEYDHAEQEAWTDLQATLSELRGEPHVVGDRLG